MTVRDNLAIIRENIEAACQRVGRDPADIRIVAVTKYVSVERAKEALEAGITDLGENRDDGLLQKYEALGNEPTWHFIGTLQSRKVKHIIDKVDYIHSLDRMSLAKEIEKRATKRMKCFVQVNVSGEATKHGLAKEEVIPFIEQLRDFSRIEVIGLMTMAPYTDDESVLRSCFRQLKLLQENVQALHIPNAPCTELSMGMSNDYEIAIEEGATFIRLGTSLVGKEC
ncbi:YggS family pyridoxal phosphate-dependent enzyme [Parageobacillus thermoglucosidasius]|uniref:YggS family pyridoxal phosphate-dependent enzyme n=1 Tax=Parageobacillus thermoglucosidasius TaxID=1426 RepID=UPI000E199489|nr:YggS family pyridoxal phosphate-dependent enzyme [Parageobacillus thermoglucosidasius]RDE34349.1 YggS family pyridoxal phosphate-dependent enzyme [Parageobacillus thermoglucosidasius]